MYAMHMSYSISRTEVEGWLASGLCEICPREMSYYFRGVLDNRSCLTNNHIAIALLSLLATYHCCVPEAEMSK